jgi:hypothetical protein
MHHGERRPSLLSGSSRERGILEGMRAWPKDQRFRRFAALLGDSCTWAMAMGAHVSQGSSQLCVCPLGAVVMRAKVPKSESAATMAFLRRGARRAKRHLPSLRMMATDSFPISDVSCRAVALLLGGEPRDWQDACGAFEIGFDGEPRQGFPVAYWKLGRAWRAWSEGEDPAIWRAPS